MLSSPSYPGTVAPPVFKYNCPMPKLQDISTVGDLRRAVERGVVPHRSVHQEVRENLIAKLRAGEKLFPGIVGYDDTVVPQLVNAILSRHNIILLGLRGQAKSRIIRL